MGLRAGRTPVSILWPDSRGVACPFPPVVRESERFVDALKPALVLGRLVAQGRRGLRRWGSLVGLVDNLRPDTGPPASPALLGLLDGLPLGVQAVLGLEGPDAVEVVGGQREAQDHRGLH